MDVKSIGNYSRYNVTTKAAENLSSAYQKNRHIQNAPPTAATETAAVAQISSDAQKLYSENNFILQTLDENSPFPFKELEEFFSLDRDQRREKLNNMLPKQEKPLLDPYIQYIFPEGSLGSFLTEKLAGKVDNPSYAAKELKDMIYGGLTVNPDATLEERAATRQAGLKLAEYISKNYFDDPEEGKAFLAGIQMFAEKNIMSEKGYIVFENSDMQPLKPYNTLSNTPADYVVGTLNSYAKKYLGITSNEQLLENIGFVLNSYTNDMKNNPQKINTLKEETVKEFAENEKKVQNIMDKAENYFNRIDFGANFMNDLSGVLHSLGQPNTAKWAGDILKLFNQ